MRRATITSEFPDEQTATHVAAAVSPDNTDEMDTRVTCRTVETTIERETTGGLRSTADDYVVNLHVAAQLLDTDGTPSTTPDT